MLEAISNNALSASIGALIGALVTFLANSLLARRKFKSDARLKAALDLLEFLGRTINRESTESLVGRVRETRIEWAGLARTLYLLNLPEKPRRAMDLLMISYLDGLEELVNQPDRRPEVEGRRELAREEAFKLMRILGM